MRRWWENRIAEAAVSTWVVYTRAVWRVRNFMMRNFIMTALVVIILVLEAAPAAWAATYYVSSSTGSDTNSGTASTAAWQTIAHVNAQTFQPGDSILFRRGDVWNESLAPPSSGTS